MDAPTPRPPGVLRAIWLTALALTITWAAGSTVDLSGVWWLVGIGAAVGVGLLLRSTFPTADQKRRRPHHGGDVRR